MVTEDTHTGIHGCRVAEYGHWVMDYGLRLCYFGYFYCGEKVFLSAAYIINGIMVILTGVFACFLLELFPQLELRYNRGYVLLVIVITERKRLFL